MHGKFTSHSEPRFPGSLGGLGIGRTRYRDGPRLIPPRNTCTSNPRRRREAIAFTTPRLVHPARSAMLSMLVQAVPSRVSRYSASHVPSSTRDSPAMPASTKAFSTAKRSTVFRRAGFPFASSLSWWRGGRPLLPFVVGRSGGGSCPTGIGRGAFIMRSPQTRRRVAARRRPARCGSTRFVRQSEYRPSRRR